MRLLGIDYGTKKIGLALSDKNAGFAFPLSIHFMSSGLVKSIKKICEDNGVTKIILGRPELFKVKDDKIVDEVEKFKEILEKEINLPVIFENEALTTQQAKRPFFINTPKRPARLVPRKKVKNVDNSSAALILQAYLDKN